MRVAGDRDAREVLRVRLRRVAARGTRRRVDDRSDAGPDRVFLLSPLSVARRQDSDAALGTSDDVSRAGAAAEASGAAAVRGPVGRRHHRDRFISLKRYSPGRLIVNADDWGRDTHTTACILDCITRGTVTAVSAMVFMEDSERAAAEARQHSVDAGLHLNFTTPF